MNIFLRELRAHRKSLIIWCIGMILLIASSMAKYAGLSSSGQSMNEILSAMPKSLQVIMGMGSLDISKALGFYGVFFWMMVVMATIHSAMLGANIIAKEERDKTAEFLMVKPVSRSRIISAKLLAAFANVLILNIVTLISSVGFVGKYAKGEPVTGDIAALMAGMLVMQVVFMVIGTGLAAAGKKPKVAASLATAILLVTFILAKAIDLNESLENLKYLTPFKYYEAEALLLEGGFKPVFIILSIVIIAAMFKVTYVFYKKRDLKV